MAQQIVFGLLAAITLIGAIGVATARTVFGSALFLILSLFGVAGLYMTLQASFLAVVQILVYVGAISVLIIFAVMLTPQVMGEESQMNRQAALGGFLALITFGVLGVLAYRADWPLESASVISSSSAIVVTEADGGPAGLDLEQARQIPGAIEEVGAGGAPAIRIPGTIDRLGRGFVTDFVLPFELISVVLLVALVGAIAVARE
jgi:NADH-quinone oxidoreductase subunit J